MPVEDAPQQIIAAPDWWFTATGIFGVVGSIAMVIMLVVGIASLVILLEIRKSLKSLNARVEGLTNRVEIITANIQDVTNEVGIRARGLVRSVDQHASTAFEIVEKIAPFLVGIGVISRIIAMVKRK
ncbi:hypothetical protein QPK87_18750 [Kamptonema cortianum]|nr:hypothetical protein [Geitlerinema splendidum]MDK3158596.1 hypothetical protein [Kamptonema cortianum]